MGNGRMSCPLFKLAGCSDDTVRFFKTGLTPGAMTRDSPVTLRNGAKLH